MSDYDELIHISSAIESQELKKVIIEKKTFLDYFSLAVTTFGVGYLPLAPGTWGSMVGVVIYLAVAWFEGVSRNKSSGKRLAFGTDFGLVSRGQFNCFSAFLSARHLGGEPRHQTFQT